MWINKSLQEIEEARSEEAAKQPIRWIVIWVLGSVFLLLSLFLNAGDSPTPGPLFRSFRDVKLVIPGVIFFLVVATIIARIFKIQFGRREVVMICPKCETSKSDDGDYACRCGGHFVDIKTMKWVEDSKEI